MPRVSMTQLRQYRMQLVLHVLAAGGRMGTVEIGEAIEAAAMAQGHDAEDWQMSTAVLSGLLRSMVDAGQISAELSYDSERGRDVPRWWGRFPEVPMPAKPNELTASPTARILEKLTGQAVAAGDANEQLAALLAQASRISSALARVQAEVDALHRDASRLMKEFGA